MQIQVLTLGATTSPGKPHLTLTGDPILSLSASVGTQPGNEVSTLVPCLCQVVALFFSQSKHHGVGEAEVPLAGGLSSECLALEGVKPPETLPLFLQASRALLLPCP